MAFESLTDRLAGVFKKLRGHGKLTEADIKAATVDNFFLLFLYKCWRVILEMCTFTHR